VPISDQNGKAIIRVLMILTSHNNVLPASISWLQGFSLQQEEKLTSKVIVMF
jgi:hypothetical protein